MKDKIISIAEQLKDNKISEKKAKQLLLDLLGVMDMLPTDEEIIKHSKNVTDFWERNGRDMSGARDYYCGGADMARIHFRTKKGDVTGDYS